MHSWTEALPVKTGYYWCKSTSFAGCKIIEFQGGYFFRDGIRFTPNKGSSFFGPISPPEVETQEMCESVYMAKGY